MTAFTEFEQWEFDLDWYAIDRDGRIGQFLTGGHRFLPPSFSSNKEMTEILSNYFENLPFERNSYLICPDFKKNDRTHENSRVLNEKGILVDVDEQMRNKWQDELIAKSDESNDFGLRMASRGLYFYDSNTMTNADFKDYVRFALPKKELRLENVPQEIRRILENLRMSEIDISKDSLITEEFVANF